MNGIFLSCVTKEFHGDPSLPSQPWPDSYRTQLAQFLEQCGMQVVCQENFAQGEGDLLVKLDRYISEECKAVVHLVGRAPGWSLEEDLTSDSAAQCDAVHALLAKYGDAFLAGRPVLRKRLSSRKFRWISVTQWEAYLAIHHGKPLFVFFFDDTAPRHSEFSPEASLRADTLTQTQHIEFLVESGIDRTVQIRSQSEFKEAVIKALVRGGIIAEGVNKPRKHSAKRQYYFGAFLAIAMLSILAVSLTSANREPAGSSAPTAGDASLLPPRTFADSSEMVPLIRDQLSASRQTAFYVGTSFHLSLPPSKPIFEKKLADGLRLRMLIFNPYSEIAADAAKHAGQSELEMVSECLFGIRYILDLQKKLKSLGKSDRFQVRLFSTLPDLRLYAFDCLPDKPGCAFVIPYLKGRSATNLPGHWYPVSDFEKFSQHLAYAEELWSSSTGFDEFLSAHAGKLKSEIDK